MHYSKWVDFTILVGMALLYRILFLIIIKCFEMVKPMVAAINCSQKNLSHHWQLLIINPTKLEVAFLCSLGKRPDKKIYEILDTAFATYNKLQRARKQKKVDWLFPTSQKQKASYECGYFLMINMLNIVSATLVGSWTQIFGDSKPVQKDEVKTIQEGCANMILEHIEANTDNYMN
ncbi:hypothetical protein P8452_33345 [Trifolium repens]|nr:hypothetical protein P8452_33345 [Trifolium repens]